MGIAQRISARLPRELWLRPVAEIWETEHRLLHALGRARPPEAVQWMVTRSCDLHCGHCYAKAGRKARDELSTQEAKRLVIDAVADMGCPLLVLAGGELWLRRDIEVLIEHAVGRGLEWAMHTHGGHVAKHRELLRRHPPSLAAISLDGEREHHDLFRGKSGSHAGALAAVQVLVEAGCREVVLGTTVTRQNADHIEDMFPTIASSGAHSWGLHLVAPEGRAGLELVPRPEQLRRLAAFARNRRPLFPVELCNEWGSAGPDDAFYRDRPFLCGAGRISMVVDPTGEVMPCTTTDPRESEGNVRDAPLEQLWREGFGRFRRGGDPSCSDVGECWLQTRNGVRIAEAAFGPVARPQPKLVDFVPSRLISLSYERLAPRDASDGFASALTRRAVAATAVGLAFIGACTLPRDTVEQPAGEANDDDDHTSEPAEPAAKPTKPTKASAATAWPASLDLRGLHSYGAWTERDGPWKRSTLPSLLTWERGGAAPPIASSRSAEGVDAKWHAAFERELERYVARGFGNSKMADLYELLDAAERAALFDPAFAAHLWRAAERVASRGQPVEQRSRLYARLADHHHIVLALVASGASLGPITQRAWLKKSAPPPGWREVEIPEGFERSARALLSSGVSGPWDSVGVSVRFESEGPSPTVHRGGVASQIPRRRATRWGRLDVIVFESATKVSLAGGVEISVPAGAVLTHASLAEHMSASTRAQLDALLDKALAGDERALAELEVLLPIARAQIRARLDATPQAAGAAALRMALVGYEE